MSSNNTNSNNHKTLTLIIIIGIITVISLIGSFANRQAEINRSAEVEKELIKQENKVIRTKERWGVLPWNRDTDNNE